MKILIELDAPTPQPWLEVSSAEWDAIPAGLIQALNVQGIHWTGYDHVSVEDLPDGACRVTAWKDAGPPGDRVAQVTTILPLAPDPAFGDAWNTRHSQVVYVAPDARAWWEQIGPIENTELRPWEEFVEPAGKRHFAPVREGAHVEQRVLHGWREWTDGIDAAFLDDHGHVADQRSLGRYDRPKGTRTLYQSNTVLATGVHVSTNEHQLVTSTGTSATLGSGNFAGGTSHLSHCWTTASGQPGLAQWPTGSYRCQLDCTAAGAGMSYGLRTAGAVVGHFARVDSGLTSDLESWAQTAALFTSTGLKLASTGSITPSAGADTDRFEVLVAGVRAASSSNQSYTLRVNLADDFVDGPWPTYTEYALAVTAVALTALSDLQRYKDLGLSVIGVGSVGLAVEQYNPLGINEVGSASNAGSGIAVSVTHGLTIAAGDVVVAIIASNAATGIADNNGSFPFNEDIDENQPASGATARYAIYTRVAGASEPSSYAWTIDASVGWTVHIRVFRNVSSQVWDVAPTASTRAASSSDGTTATSADISTSTPGCLGIIIAMSDASGGLTFSGVTNGYGNELERGGADWPLSTYTKALPSSGAVGTVSLTLASNDWTVQHVALKPTSTYQETALGVPAVAVVSATDIQHFQDIGLAVPLSALVAAAETQHYQDLGLAVPVTAVIGAAVAQHYQDLGLAVPAQAQVIVSDLEHYKDLGLQVTVQGVVSLATETFHGGGNPLEALALVAVASTAVTDLQHYLEVSLPVAAQAVLAGTDHEHYADALQVLLAATVTATDIEHWREQLQTLAAGQVTLAEAQRYREVGLLVSAAATVAASDTKHGAFPDRFTVPDVVLRVPATPRSFAAARVLRVLRVPATPRVFAA